MYISTLSRSIHRKCSPEQPPPGRTKSNSALISKTSLMRRGCMGTVTLYLGGILYLLVQSKWGALSSMNQSCLHTITRWLVHIYSSTHTFNSFHFGWRFYLKKGKRKKKKRKREKEKKRKREKERKGKRTAKQRRMHVHSLMSALPQTCIVTS